MSFQIKTFILPIHSDSTIEDEMNHFLKSHKVINIHREFVSNTEKICWCFVVEYIVDENEQSSRNKGIKNAIDYKEVLSSDDFAIYATMREWRKTTAEKNGVQLYTILNNEQMAKIAQDKIISIEKLKQLPGIGEQRIKKYGKEIIKIMKNTLDINASEVSDEKNEKNK